MDSDFSSYPGLASHFLKGTPCSLAFFTRTSSTLENRASLLPVGIVALQQSRRIANRGAAWEHKSDTVLPEKVEDDKVLLVLLGIRGGHFPRVKERRRIPFDLLADLRVGIRMIRRRPSTTSASGCFNAFM